MTRALAQMLLNRTARERALLALLLLVVIPVSFVALVMVPLQDRRAAQTAKLIETQALQDWLTEEAQNYVPIREATSDVEPQSDLAPIVGIAELERALTEAGLREKVSRLNVQDQSAQGAIARSRVTVGFDAVSFKLAMALLEDLAQRGVDIRVLGFEPVPDSPAQIKLNVTLEVAS